MLKVLWSIAISMDKWLDHKGAYINEFLSAMGRMNWKAELFLCQYWRGKIVLTKLLTVLSQVWLIRTTQVYFCHSVSFLSLASLSEMIWEESNKREKKDSFWFTFSEALIQSQPAPVHWLRWNRISCIWELMAEKKKKSSCWDPRQERDMFFQGTRSYLLPSIRLCYFIVHRFSFLYNLVICIIYTNIYQSARPWHIHKGVEESHIKWKKRLKNKQTN